MKNYLSLALLACLLLFTPATKAVKVHTIGDSTMSDYDENTTDKRGWGTYLGTFFDPAFVTINNRGKSGASSRTFYDQAAYWKSVKSQMTAGDYVLIQFAHNDEKSNGLDIIEYNEYLVANGKPAETDLRGTCPHTTYKDFLRLYIDETRELGCTPVLVAPICRKYFNGNTIKRNGQHDLGDKFNKLENGVLYENCSIPADDHTMDYVYAMRQVAEEKNVTFIDMTTATRDLYLQYGEAKCTELLFCQGDNTHTATLGANLVARVAAQLLKEAGILAQYINIPTSITASPTSFDFGKIYSGTQQNKEILLTGFGLTPESGTVGVEASGDLSLSLDKETYSSTLQISYENSNIFQTIYLRANYDTDGENKDSVVITSGETRIVIPVSANVISLEGGTPVSALWTIDARPVPEPIVAGPITAEMTLSNMMAADIKPDFTDGTETGVSMVRFHNADANGAKTVWPGGEIDENAVRYIDFAITAPDNMEILITGITMDIAAHSTNTMCCHINTGFGNDFTEVQTIYERKNFTALNIEHLTLQPTLTIPAGETLHIRVLPWHDYADEKSGKYICLKNVNIEGQAKVPTGIKTQNGEKKSSVKKIYSPCGVVIIDEEGNKYNMLGQKK